MTFDEAAETSSIDFAKFVDPTPLAVHPRLPLETVMELFKKLGPRVILIEHHGRLVGLVTVKDCLKYQFKAEAHENVLDDRGVREGQDKLWGIMRRGARWTGRKLRGLSGGRLRVGEAVVVATNAVEGGVELQDRREAVS